VSSPGMGIVAGILLCVSLALVGFPVVYALVRCVRWMIRDSEPVGGAAHVMGFGALVGRTVLAVGTVGVVSCVLAIPAAWVMSRGGRRAGRMVVVVAVPLMLPNYLAYAGWGLVRGPRTMIGDWLASGTNVQAEWKTTIASHVIAVWGLALWVWPLAAYIMAVYLRRVTPDILDGLRLDGGRARGRWAVVARLSLPGLVASVVVVMLVMLGSVVPLDVAQVETFSIHLLRLVTQRQHIEEAWIAGWPVYVVAVVGACVMSRQLCRWSPVSEEAGEDARAGGQWASRVVWLVWGLAVVAPMGLFVYNMREPPGPLTVARIMYLSGQFWRECVPSVVTSAWVGGMVACGGVGMMLATWLVSSRLGLVAGRDERGWVEHRVVRGAMWVTAATMFLGGLMPGTLIGSAINRAWNSSAVPPWLGASQMIVPVAHLARFGYIAVLVGWWVAREESAERRDLRRVDGATGMLGWLRACLAAQWQPVVGTAVLLFVLSFHEIEATVQVQQPGQHALAQQLLDWLHMARDENLAAAAVNLLGLSGVLGLLVGWLLRPRRER